MAVLREVLFLSPFLRTRKWKLSDVTKVPPWYVATGIRPKLAGALDHFTMVSPLQVAAGVEADIELTFVLPLPPIALIDLYFSTQKDVNYIARREKASDKEYAEYNSVDVKFVVWRACLHA